MIGHRLIASFPPRVSFSNSLAAIGLRDFAPHFLRLPVEAVLLSLCAPEFWHIRADCCCRDPSLHIPSGHPHRPGTPGWYSIHFSLSCDSGVLPSQPWCEDQVSPFLTIGIGKGHSLLPNESPFLSVSFSKFGHFLQALTKRSLPALSATHRLRNDFLSPGPKMAAFPSFIGSGSIYYTFHRLSGLESFLYYLLDFGCESTLIKSTP